MTTPTGSRAASSSAWPSCAPWRCGRTLLLLDEVTSALDPSLVGEVLDLLRDLAASGTTMLIATHEMNFARDVAHQVAYLDQGVLVESGTPEQIFDAPREAATRAFLERVR